MLDVLIVGAGPTGMTLSLELSRYGVSHRLIEASTTRSDRSRALVVQSRTLELLQRLGLSDPIIARGQRGLRIALFAERRPLVQIRADAIGLVGAPFPFALFISQADTETILQNALGTAIEWNRSLAAIEQDARGVRATLADGEVIEAAYVVGADGAHSAVRKALGLPFDGAPYREEFMLCDAQLDWDEPNDQANLIWTAEGIFAVLPLRDGVYRFITSRVAETASRDIGEDKNAPPALAEFQDKLTRYHGRGTISQPTWLARFHVHHRGVPSYRQGRVFVAGDAAHIHSPAGGQGMNTGMQDAINLGWKLAQALRGVDLLDSYHAERHPIGQRLLERTDRLFTLAASQRFWPRFFRTRIFPLLAPLLLRSQGMRQRAFRFISQLGIRYRRSPIVRDTIGSGPIRAGDRAPDVQIGETTLFALLRDPRHQLFTTTHAPIDAAFAATHGVSIFGAPIVLVRPDGHIAFRGRTAAELAAFMAAIYNPARSD